MCYQCCVLPVLCVTSVVCNQCCVLPVLCVTNVVCYQFCVLPVLCVTNVVCYQFCVLPMLCVTGVVCCQCCVLSVLCVTILCVTSVREHCANPSVRWFISEQIIFHYTREGTKCDTQSNRVVLARK